MSRFRQDIALLVYFFNLETLMEQLDLKAVKEWLEYISLNFSHIDSKKIIYLYATQLMVILLMERSLLSIPLKGFYVIIPLNGLMI